MATRIFLALRIFSSVLSANAGGAANITDANANVAIAKGFEKLLICRVELQPRLLCRGSPSGSRFRCYLLNSDHLQRGRIELLLDQSHVFRHGPGSRPWIFGGNRSKYLVVLLKRRFRAPRFAHA